MNGNLIFPVAEHFVSINGEGQAVGELALFIRFSGCNLECSYCDTKWANLPDVHVELLSADDICKLALSCNIHNITLTGGEPLLQKNISVLINELGKLGFRVEIETNGSISLNEFCKSEFRPSFTMDYKLPSSLMEKYMCNDNFNLLNMNDTVKFVCGDLSDLERALQIIEEFTLTEKCKVYLSPVFSKIQPSDMVEFMKKHKMNGVKLQLQLHKFIWEPNAKGV
ncbi:MAG: putative 7-carboxy-7-deazaguanine synthase QueE [Ruminococcus sp.]|nr:putative 7-carboxy-7-deazaguanine synthase QueE [Ruminococcus sp.]